MAKQGKRDGEVRSDEIWLFDEAGQDLGFVPTLRAQAMAHERGLSLVRLDQLSSPPRYALRDAGAHEKEAARAARIAAGEGAQPKEIRLRLAIGAADLETRRRNAASLLASGHRVKLRVEMDPGQRSNPAPARAMLDALVKGLAAEGRPDGKPFNEKGAVAVVLAPR
jgi:translation initiation factor IF-3